MPRLAAPCRRGWRSYKRRGSSYIVLENLFDQPLDGKDVLADDRFQTFLMYRPVQDHAQAIWVTLRRLHWSWRARAQKAGFVWTIVDRSPETSEQPVAGQETSELPVWTRRMLDIDWVQVANGPDQE